MADPTELIPKLAEQLQVDCVLSNHDYEPSAIQRDQSVATILSKKNIQFEHFKDQVIFEKTEVLTNSQTVFSVFTPYKNAWLKRLTPADVEPHSCEPGTKDLIGHLAPIPKILDQVLPTLESMGFKPTGIESYLPPGLSRSRVISKRFFKAYRSIQYR
jgi:deoxyribodipyrimidine photo-lyase